jgi:acyl-ACP thioesterase
MSEVRIHTETFTIRASEVNLDGRSTLSALCSLFQEVAGNNAKDLHFDITDMHAQNLTWVLHRMDIKMNEFPKWRQEIVLETWPATGDHLRAYRNYRILDLEGNELGCCLSYWMMINLDTRRPVRIPQEVLDTRLPDREHVLPLKNDRLRPLKEQDKSVEIHVRRSDLDMNNHVNNARYVEWMMEALTLNEEQRIHSFDIIFARESNQGDVITASVVNQPSETLFQLTNQDAKVVALAKATIS